MVATFISVVFGVLYLIALGWVAFHALDLCMDDDYKRGAAWGALAVTMLALLLTCAFGFDPNDGRLCLSGHEVWVDEHQMIGKVMTQTTHKQWHCDRWEN